MEDACALQYFKMMYLQPKVSRKDDDKCGESAKLRRGAWTEH